jgi:hypothetical protein
MALLAVASLVDDLDLTSTLGPLMVHRRTAPILDGYGEWVPGGLTVHAVRPWTAHTATGRSLQQVPEADRNLEAVEFYVKNFRFYVADDNRPSDIVLYLSRFWRITAVNNYLNQGGTYFGIGVLEDPQQ